MYIAALEERPVLQDYLSPVYRCFMDLHRARLYGLAPMGIQTTEIVAWFDLYYIEPAMRILWYELICELDVAWLEWYANRSSNTSSGD